MPDRRLHLAHPAAHVPLCVVAGTWVDSTPDQPCVSTRDRDRVTCAECRHELDRPRCRLCTEPLPPSPWWRSLTGTARQVCTDGNACEARGIMGFLNGELFVPPDAAAAGVQRREHWPMHGENADA